MQLETQVNFQVQDRPALSPMDLSQETVLFFGLGYTARALLPHVTAAGAAVIATSRNGAVKDGTPTLPYSGGLTPAIRNALAKATLIISSIPPVDGRDPVITSLNAPLSELAPNCRWAGYLSATSVYGDRKGQWAYEDEHLYPTTRRGKSRIAAELDWLESGAPVHVFRLAGIYGPGRNPFARLRDGKARAVIKPDHVVNRIHVDDIARAVMASIARPDPVQVYNIADGNPSSPQDVLDYAADMIGVPRPPHVPLETAEISDMARSFYSETKRVSIARAMKDLDWLPLYPAYRAGLTAVLAAENAAPDNDVIVKTN